MGKLAFFGLLINSVDQIIMYRSGHLDTAYVLYEEITNCIYYLCMIINSGYDGGQLGSKAKSCQYSSPCHVDSTYMPTIVQCDIYICWCDTIIQTLS